jgi:hypothetical protein
VSERSDIERVSRRGREVGSEDYNAYWMLQIPVVFTPAKSRPPLIYKGYEEGVGVLPLVMRGETSERSE